jgi:hypothetical protein|tara:strand:- start:108 stop:290 length:183 start_codon:yes stop_codon:yes gene_type:complete
MTNKGIVKDMRYQLSKVAGAIAYIDGLEDLGDFEYFKWFILRYGDENAIRVAGLEEDEEE